MMKKKVCAAAVITLALGTTAACSSSGGTSASGGSALTAHGPVKIWLSNNPDELKWGKAMVTSWNAAHPKEVVTSQEIPAGKTSEEVIGAAITAGNAPCLVYNTSPAAVPGFQKAGGLVPLDSFKDGKAYVEARTGAAADQYKSPDGKFYQIPWKSNPVMIFYNKDMMKKAGIDPSAPPLATYDEFRQPARRSCPAARPRPPSGRHRRASSSSRGSTSTRSTPPRAAARSWSRTTRPPSTPSQART